VTASGGLTNLRCCLHQVAKLLDAREERGCYLVEYTVAQEGAPSRHLVSLVALGYNGTYPRCVQGRPGMVMWEGCTAFDFGGWLSVSLASSC